MDKYSLGWMPQVDIVSESYGCLCECDWDVLAYGFAMITLMEMIGQ